MEHLTFEQATGKKITIEPLLRIYTDGSCYNKPPNNTMGVGVYSPDIVMLHQGFYFHYYAGLGTNNIAEYLAVRAALAKLYLFQSEKIVIHSDSQLVIKQLNLEYSVKNPELIRINRRIRQELREFKDVSFKWVPRTNKHQQIADELSKMGNPYFNTDYVASNIKELWS